MAFDGFSVRQPGSARRQQPRAANAAVASGAVDLAGLRRRGAKAGVRHPSVRIEYGDWRANVDQAIAPLVLAIWRHSIPTVLSCRDAGERLRRPDLLGTMSVTFRSVWEAGWFLRLVFGYQDEYQPDGWGFANVDLARYGCPNGVGVEVRIPHDDYDFVLACLTAEPATAARGASFGG